VYSRLADFPVLDEYPSRIPPATWNAWRRAIRRSPRQIVVELPGLAPMEMVFEDRFWVCVDSTLLGAPTLAWVRFQDVGRDDLSAPVPCTVLHYHFGASKIRDRALALATAELEKQRLR